MEELSIDTEMTRDDSENQFCEDWREELSTIIARNQYMLKHSICTDCTFVVGPEDGKTKEFKLHRYIMCNASAVFELMLFGEMSEAVTGNVRITDITPHTFKQLVR
jgi:hypothetical protein